MSTPLVEVLVICEAFLVCKVLMVISRERSGGLGTEPSSSIWLKVALNLAIIPQGGPLAL